ncbi:hypothetical protein L6452_26582 [Arctium lappa]|uniref:Uncharacterized protein n=1 Tax=Arctium lappa TaxID=4217 RepID=A0ACB8ZVF5_ARCLA|nr:hypothetical protein L6452_26582 [Arctium lappa]
METADSQMNKPLISSSSSRELPDFKKSIKLKYVKLGYHYLITHGMYLILTPFVALFAAQLSTFSSKDVSILWDNLQYNLISIIFCSALLVFVSTIYVLTRPRSVYLVNFSCYKPNDSRTCTKKLFMERSGECGAFTQESLDFQKKILERSGLGEQTYLPPAVLRAPPNPCMGEARMEAETVMFGAIDELLEKTKVKTKDIGILIVNCSLFNPTPSLSAMVVNRYKLRGNIASYNLGGMGCSAGLIAIDLSKKLLQVHPSTYALVISMENITLNWYFGNDRSKLVSNCLFRMGCAAILLSNKFTERVRSKYQLVHTVRTHKASDDRCYSCVTQEEDKQGKVGVTLSKDLMAVAGDALKTNITTLGPLVLPMSEQLLFFVTLIGIKILKMDLRPYIPDFKLAFEHFCIHAGGRAVLDEVEKNLKLTEWHMEPSRMTLYRFGNTSSSSLWYELAYSEAKGRVRRGDRVWQIAFGSGFKCNSVVWKALRTIKTSNEKNPWMDEIDKFPVDIPKEDDGYIKEERLATKTSHLKDIEKLDFRKHFSSPPGERPYGPHRIVSSSDRETRNVIYSTVYASIIKNGRNRLFRRPNIKNVDRFQSNQQASQAIRGRRHELKRDFASEDGKFHLISMSNSQFLKTILDPKKNWFAALHKKAIAHRLSKIGLRYDDLFDPMECLDIKEAIKRLPREITDARHQRILRAMDLSMKHEYLPKDLQARQTPFRSYLFDMLALVKREKAEREALGALPLEQRSLP